MKSPVTEMHKSGKGRGGKDSSFCFGHVKLRSLLDTGCVELAAEYVRRGWAEIINVSISSIYNNT